jgi:short-subunit dehydrogenase
MWVCPGYTKSNIRNVALNREGKSQMDTPMREGDLMSAEECAAIIVNGIQKRKRTLVMTFTGKRTVFMNKFFPSLTDKLVYRFFFKSGELA